MHDMQEVEEKVEQISQGLVHDKQAYELLSL